METSNSHIKNNTDLTLKLNKNYPNYKFNIVSFDVTSLFAKVPIEYLHVYLKPELEKRMETLPLKPDTIIEFIKLCVIDCKFTFCNKYYKHKFSLSMGNPVLSNIYMECFEKHLLSKMKELFSLGILMIFYVFGQLNKILMNF